MRCDVANWGDFIFLASKYRDYAFKFYREVYDKSGSKVHSLNSSSIFFNFYRFFLYTNTSYIL